MKFDITELIIVFDEFLPFMKNNLHLLTMALIHSGLSCLLWECYQSDNIHV